MRGNKKNQILNTPSKKYGILLLHLNMKWQKSRDPKEVFL
jgi:hypothetical protein